MKLTNWGKYPLVEVNFKDFYSLDTLNSFIKENKNIIARGLGRCYGDSALAENVASTLNFNRILSFDSKTREVECEAGTSLKKLLDVFVPRGYFMPVVPGTKFITIGGAIASDIHGKNHHIEGSFSNHLKSFLILLADGSKVECSRENNSDLFWATCGGMGLTGIILQAKFKLKSIETAYIKQETIKCKNLSEAMSMFEKSSNYTYSVAWIDCLASGSSLGRSILMLGEYAKKEDMSLDLNLLKIPEKRKISIPFDFPDFALNSFSIRLFNFFYYHSFPQNIKKNIVDYDSFFFPLDRIHDWNKVYGKRGFTQYQFVLPKSSSKEGLEKILSRISQSNQGSFLAVLKLFGKQEGLISFPKEGYTLALDFPISNKLFPLLDELDKMVIHYGGRVYLTKDVRLNKEAFSQGYPNLEKFKAIKYKYDKLNKFKSLQSERISI